MNHAEAVRKAEAGLVDSGDMNCHLSFVIYAQCDIFAIKRGHMEQPKMERLLKLIQYMSGPVYYTYDQLYGKLEISRRSLFRYLDTFKQAGFTVTKVNGNVPRLIRTGRRGVDLDRLVCFSDEEAYLVNSMIDSLDSQNVLKASLKKKLAAVYECSSLASYTDNKQNAEKIECLEDAIYGKGKVILRDYESGFSLETNSYTVEPFAFTTNAVDVWAYDIEAGRNKVFKISRIGSVEFLDENWEFEDRHKKRETDIFRMSGDEPMHIRLRLTSLAKNLLLEEYPLSGDFISECEPPEYDSKACWVLETDIRSVFGAGRFAMGLAADVEILEGERLKEYVRAVTKEFLMDI